MDNIDIKRVFDVMVIIYNEQQRLEVEYDEYISFLGGNSCFFECDFDKFKEYYSFRLDDETKELCVFNNDYIPYEEYTANDFSYIPYHLLEATKTEILDWCNNVFERFKKDRELALLKKRGEIIKEIERLNNELKNYE